MVMGLSG
jgi:hypothetical protein